jgi:hypothetical protein
MAAVTIKPLGLSVLVIAAGCSAACDTARRAGTALGEVLVVERAVQPLVGPARVTVRLRNGVDLIVRVFNSPLRLLPEARKQAKARDVAATAFAAYAPRERLTGVEVIFVLQTKVVFVEMSDEGDRHVFQVKALRGPAAR